MKRMIAGAVVAAMVSIVAATPAEAAATDPVKALKAKLGAGKGVKFTDVTSLVDDETTPFLKRKGALQFGAKGIAASDISSTYTEHSGGLFDHMNFVPSQRTIRIGKVGYSTGDEIYGPPEGKKWIKDPLAMTGGRIGWYSQVVNPAEPATLGVLVKGRKKGRTYTGTITYRALAKVSPWFRATRPFSSNDNTRVKYTLILGADNLPRKLVTSQPASAFFDKVVEPGNAGFSTETSYAGWGSRVRITAPPKSETAS